MPKPGRAAAPITHPMAPPGVPHGGRPGGSTEEGGRGAGGGHSPFLGSCPSAAGEGDSLGEGSRRAVELLLDKQLPPIYLCPYGAGEQVCR